MTAGEPFRPMGQVELRALEAQCIQDCPPACTAACPIHVDVRGVLRDLGSGNDDAALATLARALPFPGIISRICEQPCRPACVRGTLGDPIEVAMLERACVDSGVPPPEAGRRIPRRSDKVAIIGAGLAGLTAAFDLVRKGYAVTVFERNPRVGGRLRDLDEDLLPVSVRQHDLQFLAGPQVSLHVSTPVAPAGIEAAPSAHGLDGLTTTYAAVLVAVGGRAGAFGLPATADGTPTADPVTLASARASVFLAGRIRFGPAPLAAIDAVADGRRAAVSIDRFIQGVSLTASRMGEGRVDTCLVTTTVGIASTTKVVPTGAAGAYTLAEARAEARRCIACECLECVKVCEYLQHYKQYPRKAIREIYNNLSIVKGMRYANRMINSCSACGLCAEVCPTDLDMGAVALHSRQAMVAQDRMPQSAHDFALRDMAFSQGDAFAMVRNAPGETGSDLLFFPGCQLAGASPDAVERVYAHLRTALPAGTRVGLMLGCCGAPGTWAGRPDLAGQAVARIREGIAATGARQIVLACSSCIRAFRASMPDVAIQSIWEVFDAFGLPEGALPGDGRRVAVHDACATRHDAGLQDSVRGVLGRLGYVVDELARARERTTCCGYGGLQWLANADVAEKVVAARVAESDAAYVAYCAMCRDFLARGGKVTVHALDLVLGRDFDERAAAPMTGWSARHENRARLKRTLLGQVWGERMDELAPTLRLEIPDDVATRLEERLILVEDVRRVIAAAEASGRRMATPGRTFIASHRPAAVTYWVEYVPVEDGFRVINAYSHRMAVVER